MWQKKSQLNNVYTCTCRLSLGVERKVVERKVVEDPEDKPE